MTFMPLSVMAVWVLSHLMPAIKDAYAKQASNFAERSWKAQKGTPHHQKWCAGHRRRDRQQLSG